MTYKKINDLKLHNDALNEEINTAVKRVINSGWFALGPEVSAFEKEFAEFCNTQHCISVANGTDALELLLRGLGVQAGDEVITAANAGMYSSTALLAIGAKPIYVDIETASLNIDPEKIEAAISSDTKLIIATHLFGRMADMPKIKNIADKHNITLIEDCAQSHGAELEGKVAGSWADGAAFSFYPTKNLGALGDGGAIVVNDDKKDSYIRSLRQYGWQEKYVVSHLGGRNSRLDEMQAAILRVKLNYIHQWNQRRREIAALYNKGLAATNITLPQHNGQDYVAHLYVIRCKNRDSLRKHLNSKNIACDVHYPLLDYQQPAIKDCYPELHLPVSEKSTQEILTLPCYPEIADQDVSYIIEQVISWQS